MYRSHKTTPVYYDEIGLCDHIAFKKKTADVLPAISFLQFSLCSSYADSS